MSKGVAIPEALAAQIVPGRRVRVYYGKDNRNNQVRHILAIVDEDQVVYKTWWKHHQRWSYAVIPYYDFIYLYEKGVLHFYAT